ncbi:hypothetical protein I350_07504 [Cryptococcus amylolentus CBS 6273]|uniref:Uncharacterized protein n=1 Tax=Cryptococcus amylolentus CBS 6273 TaxID=1296118 RepID=A0A1E3JEM7_9TREE|nr:hypothetical protein I350_07504 [Cryptococcus amylolentus CBS 6273]
MVRQKKRDKQQPAPQPPREEIKHDWQKDQEEIDLEESLFGRSNKRARVAADDDESGMSDLEDHDLFTVDAPMADDFQIDIDGQPSPHSDSSSSSDSDDDEHEFHAFSPSANDQDDELHFASDDEEDDAHRPTLDFPSGLIDLEEEYEKQAKKGKATLWEDPADQMVAVDIAGDKRLKKIDRGKRKAMSGEKVEGRVLQARLQEQFETLHPVPDWAKNRTPTGTPTLSSLLSSTKSFIAPSSSSTSRGPLPQGTLDLKRAKNANQTNPTTNKRESKSGQGGVVDFAWHPVKTVGVMAVAGGDRRVRFFNIDGHTNPTLLTLHLPSLPLSKSTFHPSGTSLLLTGSRPYYYTYDLASQRCLRSPRNLWGSSPSPSAPNDLSRHRFSPDGSLLAVAGRRGAVSVLEWGPSGAGALVAELRSGRGGSISALDWSASGKQLNVLGGRDGAEVEIWDVGQRGIVGKWRDEGMRGGNVMERSGDGQYTAVGSTTGIVNLYSTPSLLPPTSTTSSPSFTPLSPTPYKSLQHLTLPTTSLAWHPSSSILATSSSLRKDQLKVYHLPSGTAFNNWPTDGTPLGRVTSTGFSSGGEWLGVGNQRGEVLLYGLRHFS